MHRLKAALGFNNFPVQVCRHPIDRASHFVRLGNNSLDDTNVHDANARLSFSEQPFDGNSVSCLNFPGFARLRPRVPTKHPDSVSHPVFVLVFGSTPRSSD